MRCKFLQRPCTLAASPAVPASRPAAAWKQSPFFFFWGLPSLIRAHAFVNWLTSPVTDPIKRQDPTYPESSVGGDIIIGDNCWIGGNVIILAGVTIGNACVVGAGSVVTKSIPPNSVAYGCPARVRKKIEIVADRAVSRGDLNRADLDQGQISLPLPRGGGGEERFVDDPVGTNRTAKLPLHRIGLLADAVEPGPSRTEILLAVVILLLSATVIQLGVLLARK